MPIRSGHALPLAACLVLAACGGRYQASTLDRPAVELSREEREQGWVPLFDGLTMAGWRVYHGGAPTGWKVVDGAITRVGPGGDLVSDQRFANFELALDWKIGPGGNSGIMYRVDDAGGATYETGPEMQVLDDARHPDGQSPLTSAGSVFGLYPAPRGVVKPAGEWNAAKLVVRGNRVEHWLNGKRMVQYELGSPEWEQKVAASKFAAWKGYGRAPSGRIALQDHGDAVSYRNIRIRVLP